MLPLLAKALLFWPLERLGRPLENFLHPEKVACIQDGVSVRYQYALKNLLQLPPKRQAQ
jgi:hypothetical protein